jgi:hypothetical protein
MPLTQTAEKRRQTSIRPFKRPTQYVPDLEADGIDIPTWPENNAVSALPASLALRLRIQLRKEFPGPAMA